MNQTNVYAGIVKMDENADGTLTVYGKATDSSVDIDQQICDPNWLDSAMPAWFMTGGNIREQHSNIAAGVANEYEKKADGHYISALVVDPTSVKKVKARVLKGFSIGIKSPRVVKDNKAANGRIIDGQIVEISLVDRPANPNCQLVLAKSVDGEKSLVKVEEMKTTTAKELVEELKKLAPTDVVKFDQAAYDTARRALAQLVISEAKEMEEGEDEEMSFAILFGAISSLLRWYEHEEAEGETEEMGEKSSDPIADATVEEAIGEKADGDICPDCGEPEKMCKCDKSEKELVDADGNTEMAAEAKSEETDMEKSTITPLPTVETVGTQIEEDSDEEDSSEKSLLADVDINSIVENAVKSALASITAEVAELKSAKEAVENKAATLETELATAKSLALGGGPKRTTIATGTNTVNEWKAKADLYFAKASATTDKDLAKGYRAMAKDFLAKAKPSEVK